MAALRAWALRAASTASASTSRPRSAAAPSGFDPAAPLLPAIAEDPVLAQAKLIAEPWDIGPGGYQLGALSRRLGRVERPLPRRRAPLLARRRRPCSANWPRASPARADVFAAPRAVAQRQLRHRP